MRDQPRTLFQSRAKCVISRRIVTYEGRFGGT